MRSFSNPCAGRRSQMRFRVSSLALFLFASLILLPLLLQPQLTFAHALREDEAGHIDWYLPRIGVPRTGGNSTASPGKVGPRFHKLLRPGMSRKEKGQTAIYTVTESNVITALNPKNGGIVWRQVLDDDDRILAFYTIYEYVLVLSGPGGSKVRLLHALTGHLLWETVQHYPDDGVLTETDDEASALVDADYVTYGVLPSAYTLANADTVRRLNWNTGEVVWTWTKPAEDEAVSLARVMVHGAHLHVFGLRKTSSIRALLSSGSSEAATLIHYVLSIEDAALLERRELPAPLGPGGASDIALVTTGSARKALHPHVVWLGRDGAVRSLPIAYQNSTQDGQKMASNPVVLYARSSSTRFSQLLEVGLRDKAVLVAKRADNHAEVLKLLGDDARPTINSDWEFEEEAVDAVYSGTYDKNDQAYVNRVFFQRAQHLLNFHVFWTDAVNYGERGQVTGYSFQWDHDLNGDVLAAPFEGNQVSQFQLIVRSAFVTSSGSMRMVQEDKHQWIREESLTQIQVAAFVDLPEQKLSTLSPAQAQAAASGVEGFATRLVRHLLSLQDLPAWLLDFAERFVSGTPAESWNYRQENEEREATSTMATAGPRKGRLEEVPGPAHLGPRTLQPNETAAILRRDPFGFRKVIVAGTAKGKLYAIDGAARGKVLWEKSLVGYGPGEGRPVPRVTFKSIKQIRSLGEIAESPTETPDADGLAATLQSPVLSIVAEVESEGMTLTRIFNLEALSGKFVDGAEAGTPVAIGSAKEVFGLPIVDEASKSRAMAVVGSKNQLFVLPDSKDVLDKFSQLFGKFYFTLRSETESGQHGLEGYTVGSSGASTRIWKLDFAVDERILEVVKPSDDVVASQGKVLGNRQTLYKYLNPHAQLVTTVTSEAGTINAYLVDAVTGRIVFETKATGVDVTEPIKAVYVENWIVLSYSTSSPADPHSQRLLSVEVYEGTGTERSLFDWSSQFSSFGRTTSKKAITGVATQQPLQTFQQTFVAPWGIRTLGVTRTKHGISTKSLLVATELNQIVAINRRLLDPRRPVGRKPNSEEAEELLFSYDPLLPMEPKWAVSHIFPVAKVDHLLATPASIESTSMVFAFGLDSYVSRVSPSGAFDILSANFNKVQLLLTITGLAVGIVVTKPLLRSKAVNSRW